MEKYEVYRIARLNLRVTKWHKPPPWLANQWQPAVDEGRLIWTGEGYDGPLQDWYKANLVPTLIKAEK